LSAEVGAVLHCWLGLKAVSLHHDSMNSLEANCSMVHGLAPLMKGLTMEGYDSVSFTELSCNTKL
jgi:hypothetical protein